MSRREMRVFFDAGLSTAENLAREDELFLSVDGGRADAVVRFWVYPQSLVRGKAKSPRYGWYRESVAEMMGIDVLERATGGGVVYHDEGNLNWSFFFRHSGPLLSPTKTFGLAAGYMVRALAGLGVEARFAPPNRIDVGGRKVSGLAARSTPKAFMVHGTLLLSADLEKLNRLCIPPPGCPPVANLNQWIPHVSAPQMADAVVEVLKASGFEVLTV